MDDLTPAFIKILRELLFALESGDSLSVAVPRALAAGDGDTPVLLTEYWVQLRQNPKARPQGLTDNAYHQIACELLARAVAGQPVVTSLKHLLSEAESVARADLERHVSLLPFKALAPLLLFQFPAFLVLLMGPLLRQLKNVALIAVFISFMIKADAETLDQAYLRKLDRARTAADIVKIRGAYQAIQIERRACRVQLDEKLLPKACYKTLHLERRFGMNPSPRVIMETIARLDERCRAVQRRTLQPEAGDLSHLSPKCRVEVMKTRELARYRGWLGS